MRSLSREEYWQAVFALDPGTPVQLQASTPDCRGTAILESELLAGSHLVSDPFVPRGEEIVFGSAADRLRIVWLRTHRFDESRSGGPLALVRSYEQHAEVYAVGVYRGSNKSRFRLERLGNQAIVVAKDDSCTGRAPGSACATTMDLFQLRLGELVSVGSVLVERVEYAKGTERGIHGRIEYHFTAVPHFEASGIRVHEQMSATDEQGREFRRAEMDRYFDLHGDELQTPPDLPLWDRFFPGRGGSDDEAPESDVTVL